MTLRCLLCLSFLIVSATAEVADINIKVVDGENDPVANAVVYFVSSELIKAEKSSLDIRVDQVDKEFVPHIAAVNAGASIHFPNSDNIRHQVYSFSSAKTFEIPLYSGVPASPIVFDKTGVVSLGCNIHDWMSAYVFVAANPYYAVTDDAGSAVIKSVPFGLHTLEVWHEEIDGDPKEFSQQVKLPDQAKVILNIDKKMIWKAWQGFDGGDSGGY